MPKIIDHDKRRHDIAVAACRAISRHGLDSVTLAQIAREADSTTGMLAHYFDTKWDVILAALRLMHDRLEKRLSNRMATQPTNLAELLKHALPISEEQRAEAAAWLTFWGSALKHPEILEMTEQTHKDWRSIIRRCVEVSYPPARGWSKGLMDEVISSIVVFMDGLSVKALTRSNTYSPKLLMELLNIQIAGLLSWADNESTRLAERKSQSGRDRVASNRR